MTYSNGSIKELENILVDNFFNFNKYTCFFLSHCHSDHMFNLQTLLSHIQNKSNNYLYCSPISRLILLKKYGTINDSVIKELASSTVINVPESDMSSSYNVTVTPIPAGHCAGAIMFLFETNWKTILYTGDIRINKLDITKFKPLHSNFYIKPIDKLYFDSTFFNVDYWYFPERSKVVLVLINFIKKWLKKSSEHQVLLHTSATIGYEFVFSEIAKKLKFKIHVNDFLYNIYSFIPEISPCVTNNCKSTRIHAYNGKCKNCINYKNFKKNSNLFVIKLSAQWYKSAKETSPKPIFQKISKRQMRICYSNHCSASEVLEIVNYLKPKELVSCTSTYGLSEKNKINIEELISSWPDEVNQKLEPESKKTKYLLEKNYKFQLKFTNHLHLFKDTMTQEKPENKISVDK